MRMKKRKMEIEKEIAALAKKQEELEAELARVKNPGYLLGLDALDSVWFVAVTIGFAAVITNYIINPPM